MLRLVQSSCLSFGLVVAVGVAAQTARLEPERIYAGDVAVLVIEHQSKIPSLYPIDTGEMESDFAILDKKSRVFRIVDKEESGSRMQWRLEILPRRSGRLQIPPMKLGSRRTPPLVLEVTPPGEEPGAGSSVFVETEARLAQPYVGQQTNLLMRLYHNTAILGGRWVEPRVSASRIFRSIRESNFQARRNGKNYQVLEREITLFTDSPGVIEISPASYRGLIDPVDDPLGLYTGQEYRMVYRESAPLRLTIRPVPAEFSGVYWLPAKKLELAQTWDGIDGKLRPGESIRRNISIVATGLPADALPSDLIAETASGYRIYPDREQRSNRFESQDLIGRLDKSYAIVLGSVDQIEIPPLELRWWDIDLDQERVARLPGKTINLSAYGGEVEYGNPRGDPLTSSAPTTGKTSPIKNRQLLLLAVLISGLMAIAFWHRAAVDFVTPRVSPYLLRWRSNRGLKRACLENRAQAAKRYLLEWARAKWADDGIISLAQIGARIPSVAVAERLAELDAALYGPASGTWRGAGLWRELNRGRWSRSRKQDKPELPRLYPSGAGSRLRSTGSSRQPD